MPRSPTSTTRLRLKRVRSLVIWAGERHRVGRVAFEYLDGNGASVLVAEQAIDDLGAIGPVIAAVATLRKFAVLAFEVA